MLVEDLNAWTRLRETMQSMARNANGALKYVPNQGNAGDALISAGTWQFFEDCQVAPTYTTTRAIAPGDSLVYAGGGNLVPEYDNCQRFLERCLAVDVARVLVLPHTIRGHEALLARLDKRFTLVCRDVASLRRVRETGTGAEVMYAPDMALYIDVPRLFARCSRYGGWGLWAKFARRGKLWQYVRWNRALNRLSLPQNGGIEVIRADAEATTRGDPRWDVSNFYGSMYHFREETDLVGRDLLSFFKRIKRVRTNRLHVGVAGALMNCEVTYLDNSYGKIHAVYDAWMRHLPRVRFES
jgi:exopolysaccharide biosynthesis predicted pyruvyltransferase EpsI